MAGIAVVIVAGGEATRLPGKLERRIAGTPLLLHVYRNLRGAYPVFISARASFQAAIDEELECPVLVDRWPGRGPLGGLLTACGVIRERKIFAAAADAPALSLDVLHALEREWKPGDEAVVAEHDGRMEPLAALYDRAALMREGWPQMQSGKYSLHGVLGRMAVRPVCLPPAYFLNVNTAADLERIGAATSKGIA